MMMTLLVLLSYVTSFSQLRQAKQAPSLLYHPFLVLCSAKSRGGRRCRHRPSSVCAVRGLCCHSEAPLLACVRQSTHQSLIRKATHERRCMLGPCVHKYTCMPARALLVVVRWTSALCPRLVGWVDGGGLLGLLVLLLWLFVGIAFVHQKNLVGWLVGGQAPP